MDWVTLFDANGIEYVTRGPNTKRGEVSIRCPFCGDDDPSHHMGVSLTGEAWGCHRSADHRGRSPARLIAAVLGCTFSRAKLIAYQYSRPDPDSLTDVINLFDPTEAAPKPESKPLKLPLEFKPIPPAHEGYRGRFYNYLKNRGFENIYHLCWTYHLRCAEIGRFKDRIIIPLSENKHLVGWTARAISEPREAPRYLTEGPIKETIFNFDKVCLGGDTLIVVEGPFDALKLDWYSPPEVVVTCVFGTSMTMTQIGLINEASKYFKRTFILFDPEAIDASFAASDWLIGPRITVMQLPEGIEDPGAMTRRQVEAFIRSLG